MFCYKKIILFLILVIIFAIFGGVIFAQEKNEIKLSIAPPVVEPFLKKGETYRGKILIENKNNFLLPVEIELTNFNARDETGAVKFQKENEAVDWFFIEKPNFILEAKEKKWISFEIKVPPDAGEGCYYVSMVFKPKLSPTQIKENQTLFIPNLTSLFLIGVESRGKVSFDKVSFDIVNIETKEDLKKTFLGKIFKADFLTDNFFIPFDVKIKNNGICHIRPKGTLEVFGRGERKIGEIQIEGKTVLPQKTRIISFNFSPLLYEKIKKYSPDFLAKEIVSGIFFGKYKAVLALHGSAFVKKEFEIFVFPWKNFLALFLLILILIFAFCKIKRKKQKKGQKNKSEKRRKIKTKNKKTKLTKK